MISGIKEFVLAQPIYDMLAAIVAVDTTQPEGNEDDLVQVILSMVPSSGVKKRVLPHGGKRSSLVLTLPGKDSSKSVALIGHMDTVPVGHEADWNYPSLAATRKGDMIFGRGTADMKGGLTAMLLALLYFVHNRITPKYDVHFVFTADEEASGIGIREVVAQKILANCTEVIITEPTAGSLGLGEKGALWLEIRVKGRTAHSAMPEQGINAVEHLVTFIQELQSLIGKKEDAGFGKTTLSITKIAGGVKDNMIPDEASATIDIRTGISINHEEVIAKAKRLAERAMNDYPGLRIEVEVLNNRPPLLTESNTEFARRLKRVMEPVLGSCRTRILAFYSDASQLIPQHPVPFAILGPGDDSMAHKINEYVTLQEIAQLAEIYIRYILCLEEV